MRIEPSLRPPSPKNGNISAYSQRLLAISPCPWRNRKAGDRSLNLKSPLLAGISPTFRTAFLGTALAGFAAGCGSAWLLHLRTILFNHSERYRWFSGPLSKVDRDLNREHREIAEAALSRDSERAVALMNEHLQMTARVILDSVLSGREPAPKSAKAKPGEAYVPEGLPRKLKRGASSA